MNLWFDFDVSIKQHRELIRLSPGCALLRGRLDTRYSPVRRSPSIKASFDNDAPRLACVKPVASVHPEPGSNSPLYKISFYPIKGLSLTYRTLYPVVFIEAILLTVVLYTQEYPIKDTLASCTTFFSVLCKLLKDLVL